MLLFLIINSLQCTFDKRDSTHKKEKACKDDSSALRVTHRGPENNGRMEKNIKLCGRKPGNLDVFEKRMVQLCENAKAIVDGKTQCSRLPCSDDSRLLKSQLARRRSDGSIWKLQTAVPPRPQLPLESVVNSSSSTTSSSLRCRRYVIKLVASKALSNRVP
jgi:hypothetical protein